LKLLFNAPNRKLELIKQGSTAWKQAKNSQNMTPHGADAEDNFSYACKIQMQSTAGRCKETEASSTFYRQVTPS